MNFISLFFYNFVIFCYHSGIKIAALFHPKAKKWADGRKDWERRLVEKITFPEQPIWIHCASLGEFEQGRPLMEAIKKQRPATRILLTFYSPSGYEVRHNFPLADAVVYLPPDGQKNAQKFLKIVNPRMAIFVKYEFWYYYLYTLKKQQVPTYLISAIFRKSQPFFKWYGDLHREMLRGFEHIFLQDDGSYQLLKSILSPQHKISIVGDTRIDQVVAIQATKKALPIIEQFCANYPNIFICGSTWGTDENLLIPFINSSLSDNYKTIIAPHEVKASHISAIQKKLTIPNITYSQAQKSGVGDAQILVIDNIGLLAYLYRFGKIAYIGGGFGSGIHNTLEPIVFGLPVIFGKKFTKFPEAVTLVKNGGAFSIKDKEQFITIFNQLQEADFYNNTSKEAIAYLEKNKGATKKILEQLF